jgi:hypothetical protein
MKKSCHITVDYEGGTACAWAIERTAKGVEERIEELCRPEMRGSQQITPRRMPTKITLHVDVESQGFKVWAVGTDGYEKVEERALALLAATSREFNRLHGIEPAVDEYAIEKRAIQL